MISPDFSIVQAECDELTFEDITPAYSPRTPWGYGAINTDAADIVKTEISLDFGINGYYKFERQWNQTQGPWTIHAYDIPYQKQTPGCSDCGVPCGCEGCSDVPDLDPDCNGYMTGFPEGCITAKFEIFSQGATSEIFISEGVKVKRIISTCYKDKRVRDLANKLTLGDDCKYNFFLSSAKRKEYMNTVVLAKMKLDLSAAEPEGCDCECIASRIKLVGAELDSIPLR